MTKKVLIGSVPKKLVIGTRGSKMALAQTGFVADAIKAHFPKLKIEIKVIVTKGDKNMDPIPAGDVGKAWFTKEIEKALLDDEIDLAIHSLKDLAPELPKGLAADTVLAREDPRDVLIAKNAASLASLPEGAIIGTDSIRRKALLLRLRTDLNVKSIRGNVQTRLQKLEDEDYDAIILAAAGLIRLGTLDIVTEFMPYDTFVPAVGQGVLAAEAKEGNKAVWDMVKKVQDPSMLYGVAAEQAFSRVIGGGCKFPVGCYVQNEQGVATIYGMLGRMDASKAIVQSVTGPETEAIALAEKLARELLEKLPLAVSQ